MPVVVGGWDSYESFQAAVERGEVPAFVPEGYVGPTAESGYVVQPGLTMPTQLGIGSSAPLSYSSIVGNATPFTMVNPIVQSSFLGGAWSGFNPSDMPGSLSILHAYMLDVYGSTELGVIRFSSEVLENEPTGIRPGTMERIVIPAWARLQRGSPL